MDFKSKIQKIFHTDKWWGKIFFVITIYVLYWFLFYGTWILVPENYLPDYSGSINTYPFLYTFVIIPIVGFLIPIICKKQLNIKISILYSILLTLVSFVLFIYIELIRSASHWLS